MLVFQNMLAARLRSLVEADPFDAALAHHQQRRAGLHVELRDAFSASALVQREADAAIGADGDQAGVADQHDPSVVKPAAVHQGQRTAQLHLVPAVAVVGRAVDIAAHAVHQQRAVAERQRAEEGTGVVGVELVPVAPTISSAPPSTMTCEMWRSKSGPSGCRRSQLAPPSSDSMYRPKAP